MSIAAYNGRKNLFEVLVDENSAKNFIKKSQVHAPPPPKKKETKKDEKKSDSVAQKQETTSEKVSEKQPDQKIEGFQEVNRSRPENKDKKTEGRAKDNKGDAAQKVPGEGRGRPGFEGRGRGNREGRPFEGKPREGFQPRPPREGGAPRDSNVEGGRGYRPREFKNEEGGQGGRGEGGQGGRGYRGEGGQGGRGYRGEGGRGRARDENRVEGAEGGAGFKEGGYRERRNYQNEGEGGFRRRNYEGGGYRERGPRPEGEGAEGGGGRRFVREGDSRPFRDSSNFYQQPFESHEDNPNISAADIGIPKETPSNAPRKAFRDTRRERGDVLVEDTGASTIKPKFRSYDRKPGTGRPLNENKKQGAGKGNWGSVSSEADLTEDTIDPHEPSENKPSTAATPDATSTDKTTKAEGPAKSAEEKAAEEEARQITLSEYIRLKSETHANIPLPQPRKAGEGYSPTEEWAGAVQLTRERDVIVVGEKAKKKEKKHPETTETKLKPKTEKINVEFKVKQKQPSKFAQERENRDNKPKKPPSTSTESTPTPEHEESPATPASPAPQTEEFPTLSKKA